MSEQIRQTPLRDFHLAHGGRLVPFAGWELPVQYTAILDEHKAVREKAGMFDVSHMGEVTVEGPQALAFLQRVLTNDISRIDIGQAIYSLMCYDNGTCVDDVICYRRDEEKYFICVNASNAAKDIAWMQEKSKGYFCTVADCCDDYAQIAIQGPLAWDVVYASGFDGEAPARFCAGDARVAGCDVFLSRTGYTGEDGCEIYCKPGDAMKIAKAIWYAGEPLGLALCGLGARDSLRLEAGMPLYGHEISDAISPLQAGLGWAVKLDKDTDFIGKAALAEEKARGPERKLLHFTLEGRRIAREGTAIVDADGNTVGQVRSGSFSPTLGKPIGSALVNSGADRDSLLVDLRGNKEKLIPAKAPLHKNAR
ncbi:MAG: glycine cleavage system aminomethyltransferase GcvT [Opitutales bacterium]|nr:glycine cleavage system aminomethyltransferase GcvT [Opitutales bacterium]